MCNSGRVRDTDLLAMLSYPYSSEPAKSVKTVVVKWVIAKG
jgi:hypothetical protein